MPSPPPQPNVLKIEHLFSVGEDLGAQVTLHQLYSGPAPTNADLNTYATYLGTLWPGTMASLMTPDRTLEEIVVTDLTSTTASIGSASPAAAGSLLEAILPASTCTMVNYRIQRRYRGGKPRSYWPFGSGTRLADEQTWTAGWLTLVFTEVNAYHAAMVGHAIGASTGGFWVSISQFHGFTPVVNPITGRTRDVPTPRAVAIAPDVITAQVVHPRPCNQRRRALNR